MNRYDERYVFRLAKSNDIEAIMNYIGTVWKKGHILSQSKEIFEYEFRDGEDVHFVLVIDKNSGEIAGLGGYYIASKEMKCPDTWGSIWSVRNDADDIPMLGIELGKRMRKIIPMRSEIGVGVNRKTAIPLSKRVFKDKVGVLDHYYMLHDQTEYHIAQIVNKNVAKKEQVKDNGYSIQLVTNIKELETMFEFQKFQNSIPYKDAWYINKRYLQHPVYQYEVYAVHKSKKADAILVVRKVYAQGAMAIRIVDYIGDKTVIAKLGRPLHQLLGQEAEYMDFYCYGFDQESLEQAGFTKKTEDDPNIIPNYFEPFERCNVDIWFNSTEENITICKADADQDRPNILK